MSSRILTGMLMLVACCAFAQNKFSVKPKPGWVKDALYDTTIPDTSNTSGGYYYLLFDRQYNLPRKEFYRRYATKVISEKGLQYVASINESFNPAYQSLVFHSVLIHRDGQVLNRLDAGKVEVVRREENMERYVYDKSLTAVLNLEDVRVGDIVEYSYTISGLNPVFQPYYFNTFYFNYGEPVGKITYTLMTEKSRKLVLKYFNQQVQPEISEAADQRIYYWEQTRVPALHMEDNAPSWYTPYNAVQFSDVPSWGDLEAWASKIFEVNEQDNALLTKKLQEIRAQYPEEEDRILACIRFVQEEIRYLSFSDGIHSHKPHRPNAVAQQKFGDCKDKSLLLAHMLNALGVESHPALVSTELGQILPERLPDPWNFDHCIVQFTFRDSVHWVDPTLDPQVGRLKNIYFPSYKNALVIGGKAGSLTAIPFGNLESMIDVKEEYFIDELGGSATLKVTSEFRGDEADAIRSYREGSTKDEVNQNYLNFYANDFVGIEATADVLFEDDKAHNVLISKEEYIIKDFWTLDSVARKNSVQIYARLLASYLPNPSTKVRKMPLQIAHPRKIFHSIKLHFPEAWSVQETSKKIESEGFIYHSSIRYWANTASLRYSYVTKADFIPASASRDHAEKLNQVRDDLVFIPSYTPKGMEQTEINYPYVAISLIVGAALYFAARKAYAYDPSPLSETAYDQIGGWLGLLALGIVVNPFIGLYSFFTTEYFNAIQWQILTDSSYGSYNPSLGLLVLAEMVLELVFIAFAILIAILFFKRRSSVPKLLSIFFVFNLLFLVVDQAGGIHFGLFDEGDISNNTKAIIRTVVSACIWIPYLFRSERSRGTFTVRL